MAGTGEEKQARSSRTCVRTLSILLVISLAAAFTFTLCSAAAASADPTVTSVSPDSAPNVGNVEGTIVGTDFVQGCRVAFTLGGASVEANSVTVTNPSSIDFTIDITGAATGAWDVKVINPDGHEGTLAAGFAIVADSGSDPHEPNDTIAQAGGPLSQGVAYPSYMSRENDVDYFGLVVPSGCTRITATLTSIPYGCDMDLGLFNASAQKVGTSSNGGDTNEVIELASPAAGQYYLEVKAWSGYSNDDSYSVAFTLSSPPSVSTLSPAYGVPGTVVTINGSGFGSVKDGSCVTFASVQCGSSSYLSWSDEKVVVRVPSGVGGAAKVAVVTSAGSSNTKVFKITPKIDRLSNSSGRPGSVLTISGQGFGSWVSGSTKVYFGSVRATVYQSWSNYSIKVKVPSGAAGGVNKIVVYTAGGSSSAKSFSVKR